MHHGHFHGQLGQQGHLRLGGEAGTATAAEEGIAALRLVGGDEGAHVFHHPQHRDAHLLEHGQAAASILERNLLGGGDNQHTRHGHGLGQGKLGVAGPRWQVHHQHIQDAPVDLVEKLADDAVEHRSPPDHRLVVGDQQPHGHHHQPAGGDRREALVSPFTPDLRGAAGDAQHRRGIGAIDVGVQQADPEPGLNKGAGQIHGHRALADAPLAAADGDHLGHPGDRLTLGPLALAMAGAADRSGGSGLGHFNLDIVDVGEAGQGRAGLRGQPVALGGGELGQGQGEDGSVALAAQPRDPAKLVEGAAAAGITNSLKRLPQGLVVTGHPGCQGLLQC